MKVISIEALLFTVGLAVAIAFAAISMFLQPFRVCGELDSRLNRFNSNESAIAKTYR